MKRKFIKTRSLVASRLRLSKRQQFVIVTCVLTLLLVASQVLSSGFRLDFLLLLGVSAYGLAAIALRQDLSRWEFLTLLTLPAYYTMAVYLFYLLLPARWLTRLPIAGLYALGIYAILLTENIYNVAAERTIQLLRAAHSVGFLLTLLTVFLLVDTLISFRLPVYLNALIMAPIIFPLSLQALWAMELTETVRVPVWLGSIVITLIIVELAVILSFWPLKTTIAALFIAAAFYTLVGMTQQYLQERLFVKTVREYLAIFFLVLILVYATTRWSNGIM